jgi:hypothetical protein
MVMLVDCEGRLKGKNIEANYFINSAYEHGKNLCSALWVIDHTCNTAENI